MIFGPSSPTKGRKLTFQSWIQDAIDNLTQKIQTLEERIDITRKQIGEKKVS